VIETPPELIETPPELKLSDGLEPQFLECICLLTTKHETHNRFTIFLKNLLETLTLSDLDFIIFTNVTTDIDINLFRPFFKTVQLISHNLSPENDIYTPGLAIGPNNLFFKSMNYCKKYNTVLVLETDCVLKPNWVDTCVNYVKNTGSFLVSGSDYNGTHQNNLEDKSIFFHINGVAFYNTRSHYFHTLIEKSEEFLIRINHGGGYDLAMTDVIFENIKNNYSFYYWRFVYKNIIKNSFIINCAVSNHIPIEEIEKLYPCAVIIHKK